MEQPIGLLPRQLQKIHPLQQRHDRSRCNAWVGPKDRSPVHIQHNFEIVLIGQVQGPADGGAAVGIGQGQSAQHQAIGRLELPRQQQGSLQPSIGKFSGVVANVSTAAKGGKLSIAPIVPQDANFTGGGRGMTLHPLQIHPQTLQFPQQAIGRLLTAHTAHKPSRHPQPAEGTSHIGRRTTGVGCPRLHRFD